MTLAVDERVRNRGDKDGASDGDVSDHRTEQPKLEVGTSHSSCIIVSSTYQRMHGCVRSIYIFSLIYPMSEMNPKSGLLHCSLSNGKLDLQMFNAHLGFLTP